MNIDDLINENLVFLNIDLKDNLEVIKFAGEKLEDQKRCNSNYVKSMIDMFNKFPGVIVLDDKFAMPHARPEDGAIKNGLCFVKLKESVDFKNDEFEKVDTILALCSTGSDLHIEIIQLIALLLEHEIQNQNFETKKEVIEFIKNVVIKEGV